MRLGHLLLLLSINGLSNCYRKCSQAYLLQQYASEDLKGNLLVGFSSRSGSLTTQRLAIGPGLNLKRMCHMTSDA